MTIGAFRRYYETYDNIDVDMMTKQVHRFTQLKD